MKKPTQQSAESAMVVYAAFMILSYNQTYWPSIGSYVIGTYFGVVAAIRLCKS